MASSHWLMFEHIAIGDPTALSFLHGGNGAQSMHLAVRKLT